METRVRAALPAADGYRVFANVAWTGRTREHGQLSDGEADLVIANPERGFLVVETKSGEISRDAAGRWWAGRHELKPDPFAQAKRSLHALLAKLDELPDRPADFHPLAGALIRREASKRRRQLKETDPDNLEHGACASSRLPSSGSATSS